MIQRNNIADFIIKSKQLTSSKTLEWQSYLTLILTGWPVFVSIHAFFAVVASRTQNTSQTPIRIRSARYLLEHFVIIRSREVIYLFMQILYTCTRSDKIVVFERFFAFGPTFCYVTIEWKWKVTQHSGNILSSETPLILLAELNISMSSADYYNSILIKWVFLSSWNICCDSYRNRSLCAETCVSTGCSHVNARQLSRASKIEYESTIQSHVIIARTK